jgi:hypothetical protein
MTDPTARIRQLEQERDAAVRERDELQAAHDLRGGLLAGAHQVIADLQAERDEAVAACAAATEVVVRIRALFDRVADSYERSGAIMRVLDSTPVGAIGVDTPRAVARLLEERRLLREVIPHARQFRESAMLANACDSLYEEVIGPLDTALAELRRFDEGGT